MRRILLVFALLLAVPATIVLSACSTSALAMGLDSGGTPVLLDAGQTATPLVPWSRIVHDPQGRMTLAEALQQQGKAATPHDRTVVSFGFSNAVYWLLVPFENTAAEPLTRLLVFEPTWLDKLEVTLLTAEGQLPAFAGGDRLPFAHRSQPLRHLNCSLTFPPGRSLLVVRAQTRDPFLVGMTLWEDKERYIAETDESSYLGLVYGAVAAMLLFNLALFFSLRETVYAAYVVYLCAFLAMSVTYHGFSYPLFWPEAPEWGNWAHSVFLHGYAAAVLFFAMQFLELRSRVPAAHRLLVALAMALGLSCILTAALGGYTWHVRGSIMWVGTVSLLGLLLGAWSLAAGNQAARFYLLGSASGLLGTLITTLAVVGVISFNPYSYRAVEVGVVLDAILLSLALADRLRLSRLKAVRLAAAMEHAVEEIILTDARGMITYVNPAQRSITGYADEEVLGRELARFGVDVDDSAGTQKIREILRSGEKWEGRLQGRNRAGKHLLLATTIAPILDSEGRMTGHVATRRDITQQVETGRQLAQAQKMEAIGTLAGGIAHDFNNILTAIMGFTQLALLQPGLDNTLRDLLAHIQQGSNRARDLVRQILAFSRKAERRMAPLQLGPLVKESLQFLRASISTAVEIRQDIASSATVLADVSQLHQVVLNLCTNAYQAMGEEGGILAVSLREIDCETGSMLLPAEPLPPGRYVVLEVSDTGCGMDRETMSKIFEPYFTTKEVGKGTGLGLAVVDGIIKSHGGRISVDSDQGKGTQFRVYLPVVDACELESTSPETAMSLRGNDELCMFVDDEEAIRQLVGQALPRFGYRVELFSEGASALARLRQDPASFALLITDMNMPVMDGKTLAQEAMKLRPDLPVILCSGFSALINADKARALGIREYVQKPVGMLASFRRKPESSVFRKLRKGWTPVFTGVTTFCETIRFGQAVRRRVPRVRQPGRSPEDVVLLNGYVSAGQEFAGFQQPDELGAVAVLVLALGLAGQVEQQGIARLPLVLGLFQQHAESRHRGGKAEVLAGPGQLPCAGGQAVALFQRAALSQRLVADLDGQHLARCVVLRLDLLVFQVVHRRDGCRAGGNQLVEGGDPLSGAHLAGVFGIVLEILIGQHAVFIAEQAKGADLGRIELHLDLDVVGLGKEVAAAFLDQHLFRLQQRIDIGIVAIAGIGENLHRVIMVIAHAETQHGQIDAALAFVLDQALQLITAGDAHVEIAVRGQNDAVVALGHEALFRHLVGGDDAARGVGGTAGVEVVDGGRDLLPPAARRGRQHHPVGTGINNDADAVLLGHLLHQHQHGLLEQGQLVRLVHGTGHVHQKDEVRRRQGGLVQILRLEADAYQLVARLPGTGAEFGGDGERLLFRFGIVIGKIVDHLLDAHRAHRRQLAGGDQAADVAVGGGVHVDGEGGEGVVAHVDEGVVL